MNNEFRCSNCGNKCSSDKKTGLCRSCFYKLGILQKMWTKEMRLRESIKKRKEGNPNWLGEKITYRGLHKWIVDNYGKAKKCSYCNKNDIGLYDWANITGEYNRNIENYVELCRGCHIRLDRWKTLTSDEIIKEIRKI